MTTALTRPVLTGLGGDPAAIRQSALAWSTRAHEWSLLADELRAAAPGGFVGDEADGYRDWLAAGLASRLDLAAEAWSIVGRALARYADDLTDAQQRLRAISAAWDGGDGLIDDADAPPTVSVDPWAQAAVDQSIAEHAAALARCRSAIDRARGLCPGAEPRPSLIRASAHAASAVSPAGATGRGAELATMAGGLRTASGIAALAWAALGSPGTTLYPAGGEQGDGMAVTTSPSGARPCGGSPASTELTPPTMPSPSPTTSRWPALLGIPPGMSQAPIYDSTTSAPSAPAPAPVPTTGASGTTTQTAPPSGQSVTVEHGCTDANEPQVARLPRGGPFPFEPKSGQRLSVPQGLTRKKGGFVDTYDQIWQWSEDTSNKDGDGQHHGHWDVQNERTGKHTNVNTDGTINHKENRTGRNPKPSPDSADSSYWLDDLLGGVFTVHLDPQDAAKVAALTALAGGLVYIFGGILAGG